jgi:DNA-binding MarR family transcriptional regulator
MSELAEALVIDRGALAHNLKPLERDRLVEIKVDSKDRRNHLVALTSAGRARLAESDVFWARAQRGFDTALRSVPSASLREALRLIVSESFASTFEHAA